MRRAGPLRLGRVRLTANVWRGGWAPWLRLALAHHDPRWGGGHTLSLRFGALGHRCGLYVALV